MSREKRDSIDRWNGDFLTPTTSRRNFIAGCGLGLCALPLAAHAKIVTNDENDPFIREARYYKKLPEGRVECQLCPRKCQVADKERGYCGVRENRDGLYYTLVHSRVAALNIDPIEKKPLFHFHPGQQALSLATAGCNIECKFCQNWNLSQFRPEQVKASNISPEQMVGIARERKVPIIAFTYSEPVVFYEYMDDIAVAGNKLGVESVMISNGYIQQKPMQDLIPHLAAIKIDLKAFTESFYKDTCKGELQPVLDCLKLLARSNIWYEIVVLIIPTLNDNPNEIRDMSRWILNELGPDVPVQADRVRRAASDSGTQGQAWRGAVFPGCQPPAHLLGREGAGRPLGGARLRPHPDPHGHPHGRAGPAHRDHHRLREGRPGGDQR